MKRFLHAVLFVSALLSLPSLWTRYSAEKNDTVAIVIDGRALLDQARTQGLPPQTLLRHYREAGVTGIGIYEETVNDRVNRGAGLYVAGSTLAAAFPTAGFLAGWHYTTVSGVEAIPLPQHRVFWQGNTWIGFPRDIASIPIGPNNESLRTAYRMGFYIVYRPQNHRYRPWPVTIPPEARAIAFAGNEALGWPDRLGQASQSFSLPVAFIEGAPQLGLGAFTKNHEVLRLFSLNPAYQLNLAPDVAARKYVLAARERGHRLLYFRPYPKATDTERFLGELKAGLERAGISLGPPKPLVFSPSGWRLWAWPGLVAGLILLSLAFPARLAAIVTAGLLVVAFGYGQDQAGPLLAGLTFPALGFLGRPRNIVTWLRALGYTLLGAIFMSALGSTQASMLALATFRGVGLLLIIPPALVLLSQLPKDSWRETLVQRLNQPIRLVEAMVLGLALAAFAIALLRRGNDAPFVPQIELLLRDQLQALMIRPRFKEIFGHATAVFALLAPIPNWIRNLLIVIAVIAEASILDSFAHYHTPLVVSLIRSLNGIVAGLILGLLALVLFRWARKWLWE